MYKYLESLFCGMGEKCVIVKSIKEILSQKIRYLKGVGEARELLFNKLGIFTIEDMIFYYPYDYEDRSKKKLIADLIDGETCSFEAVVVSGVSLKSIRKNLTIAKVKLKDETGTIDSVWYNQNYIKSVLKLGERYIFYGKISKNYNSSEVLQPVYEKITDKSFEKSLKVMPLYSLCAGLTQTVVRKAVESSLELVYGKLEEILPSSIMDKYKLMNINEALKNIHYQETHEKYMQARFRLVFEELLIMQLGLISIKNIFKNQKNGIMFDPVPEMESFIKTLPFELTSAQKKVFDEIQKNMESEKVMNRLVQGDVGSGKTIVAVMAMYKAVKSGYQAAFMVPTEILAKQHFCSITKLLEGHGIRVSLLTGGLTKKERNKVLDDIVLGRSDIVIGTHAIIQGNVIFSNVGLVITDEQHRFGVRQRTVLSKKGNNPDMMVMTATPIPRTLALILYGDLDISVINQLPPGRKPVKTYIADISMRERINTFIKKEVANGRQAFVVCPLIEETEKINAKSAYELAERIQKKDLAGLRVGLIHGKMRAKQKDEIMNEFVEGRIDVLVSTTIIEVGVNVPNATIMIIENAERFGLATLHQLRGRVGRAAHQSYCILFNEGKSDVARERMNVMKETNDGFVIADKDLKLRGPGEFFGARQHGLPDLTIANLYSDMDILKLAQEAVSDIMSRDVDDEECRRLKETVKEKFRRKLQEFVLN